MEFMCTDEITDGNPWVAQMRRGQTLRLTARSIVSLVCFNADDLSERFDQARTKVYNMAVWAGAGDKLYSKLNNPMMAFKSDGFVGQGRHDLQLGFGAAARLAGLPAPDDARQRLAQSLQPWGIAAEVIPSPLNLFHDVDIDMAAGGLSSTRLRPVEAASVALEAEMDLVVAAIQDPDPAIAAPLMFRAEILSA